MKTWYSPFWSRKGSAPNILYCENLSTTIMCLREWNIFLSQCYAEHMEKEKKKTCAAPSVNFNRHCLSFSKSSRVSGQEGSRNTGCAALTLTNTAVFIQSSVSILNRIWWGRCRRRFCSPLHACCFLLGCTDRSDSSPALQAPVLPWVSDVIRL